MPGFFLAPGAVADGRSPGLTASAIAGIVLPVLVLSSLRPSVWGAPPRETDENRRGDWPNARSF